jgi:transposase
MAIVTVGIDLAKNVFALHGVNETGHVELRRPSVARAKLHALVAALPPCTIAMEACTGAHHWARLFAQVRPHRQADGTEAGDTLPHERQARQERRRRRRGHL